MNMYCKIWAEFLFFIMLVHKPYIKLNYITHCSGDLTKNVTNKFTDTCITHTGLYCGGDRRGLPVKEHSYRCCRWPVFLLLSDNRYFAASGRII